MTFRFGPAWAGAVVLSASALAAQDWQDAVVKACEHRRFALRRAAANRVAGGGDAAIPAIESYIGAHGDAAIPLVLVEAIASSGESGEKTVALLVRWARADDFYWRAQALTGLALRQHVDSAALFAAAIDDPSHLYRIAGARGLFGLDAAAATPVLHRLIDSDADPRARVRLAAFLAEHDDPHGLPLLLAALDLRDDFLGDPWGARLARTALKSLTAVAGRDFGYNLAADASDNAEATTAFARELAPRTDNWRTVVLTVLPRQWVGGVEIRSCRHGDLFLRWTADGEVGTGLLPTATTRLAESDWEELAVTSFLSQLDSRVFGKVVCDYLQLQNSPRHRWKSAPGELPSEQRNWLERLAAAIERTPEPALAEEITGRLPQFTGNREGR